MYAYVRDSARGFKLHVMLTGHQQQAESQVKQNPLPHTLARLAKQFVHSVLKQL